jgi:hypothetical protein
MRDGRKMVGAAVGRRAGSPTTTSQCHESAQTPWSIVRGVRPAPAHESASLQGETGDPREPPASHESGSGATVPGDRRMIECRADCLQQGRYVEWLRQESGLSTGAGPRTPRVGARPSAGRRMDDRRIARGDLAAGWSEGWPRASRHRTPRRRNADVALPIRNESGAGIRRRPPRSWSRD